MSEQNPIETLWGPWFRSWSKAAEQFSGSGMMQHSQELMKQWQDALRRMIEEVSRSESFLSQMGRSMELGNLIKSHAEQLIERQLTALHIPSTSDLQEVHVRLRKLDDRLEDLAEQVAELSRKVAAALENPPAEPAAPKEASPADPAPRKRNKKSEGEGEGA